MKNQKTPKIQVKIKLPLEAALVLEALAMKRGLGLKAYIVVAIGEFCARNLQARNLQARNLEARGGGQPGAK